MYGEYDSDHRQCQGLGLYGGSLGGVHASSAFITEITQTKHTNHFSELPTGLRTDAIRTDGVRLHT